MTVQIKIFRKRNDDSMAKIQKQSKQDGQVCLRKRKRFDADTARLYSLCAIPVLLVLVFNYIPMVGIIIAFKDYKYNLGIFGSEWCGLKNFEYFVTSNDFARIATNTIGLNALFIVFGMAAAIMIAVLLYDLTSRALTKTFQTIMITPNFISWVVAGFMVYGFLNPAYGIVNTALKSMGLNGVEWYSEPNLWPPILVIASIWKHVGMDSILYYAALMGLDSSLFEAAEVDGATKWQRNRYILIPSLTGLVVVLTILKIGNIFRADFGLFYQLTRNIGALYPTTDVMDTYIFRQLRFQGNINLSSAAGLLQSVVGFVLVVVTNKIATTIDPSRGLF